MTSLLLSALTQLDASVRLLEEHLNRLAAGLEVPEDQLKQCAADVRQNAGTVRELVHGRHRDFNWTDRQSLERLIQHLEAAEAGQKEIRLGRLLELAEALNSGRITHRLKTRLVELEGLREEAVRELLAEAAEDEPKDLPGPEAAAWVHWACGLQEDANAAQFAELGRSFPALMHFAGEMEESYWRPRERAHGAPEQSGLSGIPPLQGTRSQSTSFPLPELRPVSTDSYSDLLRTLPSPFEAAGQSDTVGAVVAQVPEARVTESLPFAQVPSSSEELRRATFPTGVGVNGGSNGNGNGAKQQPVGGSDLDNAAAGGKAGGASIAAAFQDEAATGAQTQPVNDHAAIELSEQAPAEDAHEAAEQKPEDSNAFVPPSFTSADAVLGGTQQAGSGFGINRSFLITIGAIAVIILTMVVISAVGGRFGVKGASSPHAASESVSPKEVHAAAPAAPLSDIQLVEEIEQRLKTIQGSSIYVTVEHGTAILQGQVASEEDLARAEDLTQQSNQIKIVRNRLQVEHAGAVHSASRAPKPDTANTEP